ncbi:MAG: hypothetical protein NTU91_14265 [Chloroflexi bacterium]|nr:hypothetical protein [Chloroflexota bacterium]
MAEGPSTTDAFADLLAHNRPREALRLLLGHLRGRPWSELEPADLSMLDQLCQKGLPQLLQHHTRWLVTDAEQLDQLAWLLECALGAQYRPAATLEQLAWVRCLLGMSAAMRKDLDSAHKQMCRTQPGKADVPRPNGKLEAALRQLELLEGATGRFLKVLFETYFQCLHEMGRHEMANILATQVLTLIERIEADETRPGVVRGLFYNEPRKEGYTRLIHATLTAHGHQEGKIFYARAGMDQMDQSALEAAEVACRTADTFLRAHGYPDGLQGRAVHWEISTLQGEPVDVPKSYGGGSLGLPLAVAIVSAYLNQIVPGDTALSGMLSAATATPGDVLAVDGMEEKLLRSFTAGCRRVLIPAGNQSAFVNSPALQHAAQAAKARVYPVGSLAEACAELFPPEGKGTIGTMLIDTVKTVCRFLVPPREQGPSHAKTAPFHRLHVLLSAAILAVVFALEGYAYYLGYARDYSIGWVSMRAISAATIVAVGLLFSYGLILASLHHRKTWAWLASIAVTAGAVSGAVLIQATMLPAATYITANPGWPVSIGVIKDGFVLWLFVWVLLTNTFAVTVGMEHLISRHQYVTARRCLAWDSFLEGRMPVRAVYFPWNWGALVFLFVGVFLLILDLVYYGSLRGDAPGAYWVISLGLGRDMMLIGAAAEAMLFYKVGLAQVRKVLL